MRHRRGGPAANPPHPTYRKRGGAQDRRRLGKSANSVCFCARLALWLPPKTGGASAKPQTPFAFALGLHYLCPTDAYDPNEQTVTHLCINFFASCCCRSQSQRPQRAYGRRTSHGKATWRHSATRCTASYSKPRFPHPTTCTTWDPTKRDPTPRPSASRPAKAPCWRAASNNSIPPNATTTRRSTCRSAPSRAKPVSPSACGSRPPKRASRPTSNG